MYGEVIVVEDAICDEGGLKGGGLDNGGEDGNILVFCELEFNCDPRCAAGVTEENGMAGMA